MKAWLLKEQAGIEERPLSLEDISEPSPGKGEIRLKINVCGICRTDIHIAEGDLALKKSPLILGHEIVGVVDETGKVWRTLDSPLSVDWPTSSWSEGTIVNGRYRLQLDPHLPAGKYALVVGLIGVGEPAVLANLDVVALPRTFDVPVQMEHNLNGCFEDELRLVGYDLAQAGGVLRLALYW